MENCIINGLVLWPLGCLVVWAIFRVRSKRVTTEDDQSEIVVYPVVGNRRQIVSAVIIGGAGLAFIVGCIVAIPFATFNLVDSINELVQMLR